MMKLASLAVLAVSLSGAGIVAGHAAERSGLDGRAQWAQLNSPGDGLDKAAASEGNGRTAKRSAPQRRKSGKRMR